MVDLVKISAILSIAAIVITAMFLGVDGLILAMGLAAISGLGGYAIAKFKKKGCKK